MTVLLDLSTQKNIYISAILKYIDNHYDIKHTIIVEFGNDNVDLFIKDIDDTKELIELLDLGFIPIIDESIIR